MLNMKESAADIQKYLDIIEGKDDDKPTSDPEIQIVNLGSATGGAFVGNTYIFENGVRWATIVDEESNYWIVEHGLLEYEADSRDYISKHDFTQMISCGEMELYECDEPDDILTESLDDDDGYCVFMERVNRYLLINAQMESEEFSYDWFNAFQAGLSPIDAADEAIITEG